MIVPDMEGIRGMLGQAGLIDTSQMPDALLLQKYKAAYVQAQRELRVFFEPTEIIPDDAPQTEIDALVAANKPYHQEAAYDYEPSMLSGASFGFIKARQSPIISIHNMVLSYPSPQQVTYTIPNDWIRIDKKYGQIQLMPTMMSFSLPFSGYLLTAMRGGNLPVPFMLRIRYLAGLTDIANNWPDIVELINRMAALNVLKGAFLPGSQTLSADGFSRSTTITMKDWQGVVDEMRGSLMDSIHGIRIGCI